MIYVCIQLLKYHLKSAVSLVQYKPRIDFAVFIHVHDIVIMIIYQKVKSQTPDAQWHNVIDLTAWRNAGIFEWHKKLMSTSQACCYTLRHILTHLLKHAAVRNVISNDSSVEATQNVVYLTNLHTQ